MKKLLFILGVLGILAIFTLLVWLPVVLFKKQASPPLSPIASPTPVSIPYQPRGVQLNPLETTTIGSNELAVKKIPNLISQTSSSSGITAYEFQSVYKYAPTIIITQNNTVVFTRTSTYTTQPGGFPSFKALSASLGKVEEIIQTNITYGDSASAYVFASKGFCFIVNDNTDEVYEIMRFTPMSIQQFKQEYASFIVPAPPEKEEGVN